MIRNAPPSKNALPAAAVAADRSRSGANPFPTCAKGSRGREVVAMTA
jgi:hypothetical protein